MDFRLFSLLFVENRAREFCQSSGALLEASRDSKGICSEILITERINVMKLCKNSNFRDNYTSFLSIFAPEIAWIVKVFISVIVYLYNGSTYHYLMFDIFFFFFIENSSMLVDRWCLKK